MSWLAIEMSIGSVLARLDGPTRGDAVQPLATLHLRAN
jgi:hypothetical protein